MKLNKSLIPRETMSFVNLLVSMFSKYCAYWTLVVKLEIPTHRVRESRANMKILTEPIGIFSAYRDHFKSQIEILIGGNSLFVYVGEEFEEVPLEFGMSIGRLKDPDDEVIKAVARILETSPSSVSKHLIGSDDFSFPDRDVWFMIEPSTTIRDLEPDNNEPDIDLDYARMYPAGAARALLAQEAG